MTAEELLDQGTTHLAVGELDEAWKSFKKATELHPDHFDAWHSLGMVCMKLHRYPEAVVAARKSCELKPNDQLAHVSYSMALQKNGQIPEAEAEAAKAKVLGWGGKLI